MTLLQFFDLDLDRKYLSDRGQEIHKNFKYLWDCYLPDGNSYNHKFGEDCGIFYLTDQPIIR
ncbi:MAG: hypothetical protein AB4368_02240 [Xenococcaceae cyanobacterium]